MNVGAYGEMLVARALRATGVQVERPRRGADLVFEGVPIEVKTARLTRNYNLSGGNAYQFFLRGTGRHKTDFHHSKILVLLCVADDLTPVACYVIPTKAIEPDRKVYKVRESLQTPLADYYERWELLADEVLAMPSVTSSWNSAPLCGSDDGMASSLGSAGAGSTPYRACAEV